MGVALISVTTRTLSHSFPSLACFSVLQCVLLLGLAHLPRPCPPLWSAAGSLADLTLSLLLSPSLSSFSAPGFSLSLSCWAATSASHTLLNWCRGFWLLKSWQGWIALQFSFHHPPPHFRIYVNLSSVGFDVAPRSQEAEIRLLCRCD
jgi:hypothetical protein